MNGSSGIQPTVELATTNGNGFYPYPMVYGNGYGNGNGFFGGDGWVALIILALLFNNGGFGGFGGNGWNNVATTDYISSEFTQRDVNGGTQAVLTALSNGFSDTATNICGVKSDILENRYAQQLSACNTQRDILTQTNELNTNILTQALQNQAHMDSCCCELKAQGLENTQRILDAMNNNTIADLREKLNEAQTEISNRNIESSIINSVRPYPVPSYLVSSPYQSIYNGFYGGYYGNGFYGNTIV